MNQTNEKNQQYNTNNNSPASKTRAHTKPKTLWKYMVRTSEHGLIVSKLSHVHFHFFFRLCLQWVYARAHTGKPENKIYFSSSFNVPISFQSAIAFFPFLFTSPAFFLYHFGFTINGKVNLSYDRCLQSHCKSTLHWSFLSRNSS